MTDLHRSWLCGFRQVLATRIWNSESTDPLNTHLRMTGLGTGQADHWGVMCCGGARMMTDRGRILLCGRPVAAAQWPAAQPL